MFLFQIYLYSLVSKLSHFTSRQNPQSWVSSRFEYLRRFQIFRVLPKLLCKRLSLGAGTGISSILTKSQE